MIVSITLQCSSSQSVPVPTVIKCPGLNLAVSRESVEIGRESIESQ